MLTDRQHQYLDFMGIDVWVRREHQSAVEMPMPEHANSSSDIACDDDWQKLETRVTACTACELSKGRTQAVFGVGNRKASWLFIGEGPGEEEDRQGEPFVGPAGQLLNEMLFALDLKREEIYIANIVKCRPPDNRNPHRDEVSTCAPFLARQIELINPDVIIALGGVAAHNLLQTDVAVGKLRGKVFKHGPAGWPLVVTYHPAYLLRSPREKRKSWDDLQFARTVWQQHAGH